MVRFDVPCLVASGAVNYFREHMKLGDYLTQEGQAEMTWFGAGARRLGLGDACRLADFENLCRGLHPANGERLMVRDKGTRRRVCYFGQISPPKDVSLLYLVGGDRRIGAWWESAVRETLNEIEAVTAARVRRGGVSEDRLTGNMVAAIVTHDASRALDPQLHTHLCVMNVTFDPVEQRWKGVQPSGYFRNQGYFREVCYNRLAAHLLGAGYELEKVRGIGFNVTGVPPALRDRFSKRRRTILDRAAECGAKTQDALQALTGQSRTAKVRSGAEDLCVRWRNEAGEDLAALHATIAAASGASLRPPLSSPRDAILSAEAHVFERRSVVDEHILLREALVAARGHVMLPDLKAGIADRADSGELVRSGGDLASRDGLASEEEFVAWAGRARPSGGPWGKLPALAGLGADQVAAVQGILGATDRVLILRGDAGTGKTTCLKAVVAGIELGGVRVFGCAPSSGAAEVLRQELTADAATLQELLVNESLQRATRERVLLVDEAGLISVREMRDLCRLAERNGNRLLLVGDTKQHSAVEAGDALRCLSRFARVPLLRLTEIRRQKDPAFRRAVALLARGDAGAAFSQFCRLGAVREMPDPPALFRAAAEDYVRTVTAGKSCLAISPVWSEIDSFTTAVRQHLKSAGRLTREERPVETVSPLKWTREERSRTENYQAGDVLTFHRDSGIFRKHEAVSVVRRDGCALVVRSGAGEQFMLDPRRTGGFEVGVAKPIPVATGDRLLVRANLKPLGLRNGDLVDVAGFAAGGGIVLADGREIPAWFRQFSHGYATTSHAAQGKTVDRGILIMADDGIAAGNLKQAYVSNSRFRDDQVIFTTDRRRAGEAMKRPGDRTLAMELVMTVEPPDASSRRRRRKSLAGLTHETVAIAPRQ